MLGNLHQRLSPRCGAFSVMLKSCLVQLLQQALTCVWSENGMGCFGLA